MKKVGIGLWGLGMIGKTHLESLRLMQVMFPELPEVTAEVLCSRTDEPYKARLFNKVTDDPGQMLASDAVTLVDIPSPNYAHYEQAKAAIEARKSIYLEKPIAVNLSQAAELTLLAEKAGIINRSALLYRFIPAIGAMRELIHAGDIGDVIHFTMRFFHHSYLDPNRPTSWRQQAALSGGGSMMDLGIHFTDLIHWMFGDVKSVSAMQRTVNPVRFTDKTKTATVPNDTEEWCSAQLRMENGICGVLESSRVSCHIDSGTTIEVYGTKGAFKFDVAQPDVLYRFDSATGSVQTINKFSGAGEYSRYLATQVPPPRNDSGFFLNAHIASFKSIIEADAGMDNNPSPVTFREAYEAQRIVEMIMMAAEQERIVAADEVPALPEEVK